MSTTTTINPTNLGNSTDGKKKAAAFAATATASAAAGITGEHLVSDLYDSEDTITEEYVTPEEVPSASAQEEASSETSNTTATVDPEPIITNDVMEPDVTIEPASETTSTIEPEFTGPSTASNTTDDIVNPDDIAQAIISEEKIDPNDIDMADVVNFDEIGTVYTVDGEIYTAATFHDADGNGFVMVDVDGDDVFDIITDNNGNPLAEVPGNISVGDAQENIQDGEEYLAYDGELDNVDEYGADSLADDLMA